MQQLSTNRSLCIMALTASALAAVAATLPGSATQTPAQGADATQAAPTFVTLDPVHSVVLFRVQHLEAGLFWGRFNALEGKVDWDLQPRGIPSFQVTAKVANADTGNERLDGNLQGPNFFNAKDFPTITFQSTGGRAIADRHWTITGNLTLHGVTKPIEADCIATGIGTGPAGKKAGFECNTTIQRSSFGMNWGIEKPAKALGDEVKLVIAIEGDVNTTDSAPATESASPAESPVKAVPVPTPVPVPTGK